MKLGIDEFLANKVGYINFLTIDRKSVKPGDPFGSIESGKFVSKIHSPAGGRIVEVNQEVVDNPRRINEDPYGSWIVAIQTEDGKAPQDILESEKDIQAWIEEEIRRYEEE